MGHAGTQVFRAITLAAAIRRIERLVHCMDDVGNRYRVQGLGKAIAATGSAHALHQAGPNWVEYDVAGQFEVAGQIPAVQNAF